MSEYQYQFYGRRIIANIPLPATPYTETSGIGYSSAIRVEGVITDREMKDDMTVTENMYCISSPRVSFQIQLNPAHISVYSSGEESIVSTVFNLPYSLLVRVENSIVVKQILRDIPFYVLTVPTAIHRMEEITEQIYHHICTL